MKSRLALFAATALAAPFLTLSPAKAQPVTGPYVSGGLGLNVLSNEKLSNLTVSKFTVPGSGTASFEYGFIGQASVGYGFGNGLRVEVEGDYTYNKFGKFKSDFANGYGNGSEQKYGGFINGLYDFDLGYILQPYLGAGVGYQEADWDNFTALNGQVSANESKGSFAYQGIVGVALPFTNVPGLSATVEYRFIGLTSGSRRYSGNVGGINSSFKVNDEYNNAFLVGVRYQLNNPPPPAPPAPAPVAAPAPVPAKTYLVFFDWDKYKLTPRATQIIAQAASDSKTQSTTTIMVNGYTDTSGTAVYNQGLSVRRAKAVEAQLVTDGVPESEITAQGFGDTHLLVPTGPGVREPQNRRVEIVLQ